MYQAFLTQSMPACTLEDGSHHFLALSIQIYMLYKLLPMLMPIFAAPYAMKREICMYQMSIKHEIEHPGIKDIMGAAVCVFILATCTQHVKTVHVQFYCLV